MAAATDLSALLDAAAAAFRAGRLAQAAILYRKAERRSPGDVRATYSLAVIDLQRGRLAAARERLEAAVGLEPALFPAWHNLGGRAASFRTGRGRPRPMAGRSSCGPRLQRAGMAWRSPLRRSDASPKRSPTTAGWPTAWRPAGAR